MKINDLQYIGDECECAKIIVSHDRGKRMAQIGITFDFHKNCVKKIKVYRAERLIELRELVRKALLRLDWDALTPDTEVKTDNAKITSMVDELRDLVYYRSLEIQQLAALPPENTPFCKVDFTI